jgi:outer membrane protein assembly factor BamE (lipoprotein component of BamABCDE complex)
MTKKRWITLAGILAACVCLTLAVLAMLPPHPGVTLANIERIEDGMTLAEVEKILGGPAEYSFNQRRKILGWTNHNSQASVTLYFDGDDRVIEKRSGPAETFLQKLYRLLRL